MGLDNENQYSLTLFQSRQSDIVYLLIRRHEPFIVLPVGLKPEMTKASEYSCTGNTKDRTTKPHHEYSISKIQTVRNSTDQMTWVLQ